MEKNTLLNIINDELVIYGDYCQLTEFVKPKFVYSCGKVERTGNLDKTDQSLSRTRVMLYRYVACNINKHGSFMPVFLTLTYAKNEQNRKKANHDFNLFNKRLNYNLNHKLKYICVPEFQKRGAIHYHVIYFNLPYVKAETLGEIWTHGSIDVKGLKSVNNISAYISKYISKDLIDDRHKGHRLLITSRGLIKPTILYNHQIDKNKIIDDYIPVSTITNKDKKIIQYVRTNNGQSARRN